MPDRRASKPSRAVVGASIPLLLAGLVGCAPAGSTAATSAVPTSPATVAPTTGAPSLATSPTPVANPSTTAAPRPSGSLAWPTAFDVELEQATYFSSPPFDIPFTLTVDGPGWFSGHLHGEFFDLLRFDDVPHTGLPTRMLAFGIPEHFRGSAGDVPAAGLTAASAVDVIEDAPHLTVTGRGDVALLGLDGLRVDIHSELQNAPVFGGPAGNFGLGPELDARMAVLEREDRGFLLVLVLAEAAALDAAWARSQGILETVEVEP